MDNWNDSNFKLPQVPIPSDVFESVKSRMIQTKIQARKTQRQITIGTSLLMVLVVINISLVLSSNNLFNKNKKTETAEVLYNHYFKSNQNPFDE